MKTSLKLNSILPLAVMIIASAFAVAPVANAKNLQVAGTIETTEEQVVTPPTMKVELEGIGHATGLGCFVLDIDTTVLLATSYGTGVIAIDTGCGNTLSGTIVGQGSPKPGVDAVPVIGTMTITGGTGRFLGASGTLTIKRILSRSTGVSTGTIEGTITLPDRCRFSRRH